MIFSYDLLLDTITRTSYTVSLACRDSVARTSGSPSCNAVDFNQDWSVCELNTRSDTKALRSVVKIAGAIEVIPYILEYRSNSNRSKRWRMVIGQWAVKGNTI